ncbi:Uncharacterised protein [Bordetella pertussis]|nr:Uncharacterised protein [Bordetella pertussis]CFW30596.1 Uncharacterised protein [Bordetella pertussis]CPI51594.1 Uncharacterised protein [Bordetella pertussis]CPM44999.1 Uncharacterised protein [Bordetella pertussis]CPM72457.1 Uncharacterised protein [Bordetella pertussis]
MSAALPRAMLSNSCPVDGSMTGMRSPEDPGTEALSIKCCFMLYHL